MVTMSHAGHALLERAVRDEKVRARYSTKVITAPGFDCAYWCGSLSPKGHGRFWVGNARDEAGVLRDVCVISHRFGWAIAHGIDSLDRVPVLAHICDEPSCQNVEHLTPSTWADNLEDWQRRRSTPRSPLRDTRGPGGRARAIRAALLAGSALAPILEAGHDELSRDQLELF